jgi:CRISPR/Cas system CMR-associated protein Cmr5 small subunit
MKSMHGPTFNDKLNVWEVEEEDTSIVSKHYFQLEKQATEFVEEKMDNPLFDPVADFTSKKEIAIHQERYSLFGMEFVNAENRIRATLVQVDLDNKTIRDFSFYDQAWLTVKFRAQQGLTTPNWSL